MTGCQTKLVSHCFVASGGVNLIRDDSMTVADRKFGVEHGQNT